MDNRLNLVVNFAQAGLDQLQGGLRNLVGLGRSGGNALRDMARHSRSLERELKDVRREIDGASGNITELVERERELERAVAGANEQLRRQRALNEIDGRADAIRAQGDRMISRGRDNMMGGAAMLAPIVLAARAGGEFSSTLVDIQQKAELTDAAMVGVRNNILAAAKAGKQMPADMAFAVDTLAGLGMEVEDAAKLSEPMARFMTAFKVEGADAAASIFAGLKTMNIPLEQTGKLLDMMAEGGNVGAFEVKDMAGALPSLTAQMKALGQTGTGATAELIAMLETIRGGTGTAEQAATQAGDLLSKLTAPATVTAFQKNFGIDVPAAIAKGAKAGISPLETMIRLTREATKGDLGRLGYAFGDKESRLGMTTLIQEYDRFQAAKKQVAAASGTTDRAFDVRAANDQTVAWREMSAAMSNLVLTVSPVLLPFLRTMTDQLAAGANWVTNFAQKHPEAAGMILKLITALALGKIALGGLQFAFGGLLKPMATAYGYFRKVDGVSRFATHLTRFKTVLSATASVGMRAFTMLRTGAVFLARGIMRAGMMMLANPMVLLIVAIIAAVGLLAYAIYSNWDRIKAGFNAGLAYLSGAWTTFKGYFGSAVAFVLGLRARFQSMGKDLITGLANGILSAPGKVWSALKSVVMGGVNNVKKLLGIASPSRLFMSFGGHMADGMALGLDKRSGAAQSSARRLALGVAGAASIAAGPAMAGSAMAPAGGKSAPAATSSSYTINIHTQSGQSADEIARAVRAELDRRDRQAAAARRSSYGDA